MTTTLRRAHPEFAELAGGLKLSVEVLRQRADAGKMESFVQMLENAEYWLSFDLHAFEPVLATAPSPLRELGVAVALKFGEGIDGRLTAKDIASAKNYLPRRIAPDLRPGVVEALNRLDAIVQLRDRETQLAAEGFEVYRPEPALSVHSLRAMGHAIIRIDDDAERPQTVDLELGRIIRLSAHNEKGRALPPPEIETDTGAPLWVRTANGTRDVIFLVPGIYRLRVRDRASGDKKLIVR